MMISYVKGSIILSLLKFKFRKKLTCDWSVTISKRSNFEGMNKLHSKVFFDGILGYGSYVGPYSRLMMVRVGRFSSIAPNVQVNPGMHPLKSPYVTTSPAFFSTRKQNGSTFVSEQFFNEINYVDEANGIAVDIGSDCWIGQGVFIVGGVVINDGAVVLAGAVVTKDVPAYSIVAGVPAKIIGYRFDEESIEFLRKLRWWDKDPSWLQSNSGLLRDIEGLKSAMKVEI